MAALAVLAELDVLGARAAAARRHHDVLLGEVGRQGEARPHPGMGLAHGNHEAVGAHALAMDALRQRQGDIERGIERAVGQAGLDAAPADLHDAQVDARRVAARSAASAGGRISTSIGSRIGDREGRLASAPDRSARPSRAARRATCSDWRSGSIRRLVSGVGARLRPSRTNSGSSNSSRSRASAWLTAGWVRLSRSAARLTPPSATIASSTTSRLRSTRDRLIMSMRLS